MLDIASRVLTWLSSLPPEWIALGAALFMLVETSIFLGLVVPGDAVVILAGSSVTSVGTYVLMVAAASLGSLCGQSLGYLLGWHFGDRIRGSRPGRRLGEHRWRQAREFLDGRGAKGLIACRFVALLHALVPVLAGTVRMPIRRFLAYTAAGALVWSLVYVSLGAGLGQTFREYGDLAGSAALAVLVTVIGAVAAARAYRRRRGRVGKATETTATDTPSGSKQPGEAVGSDCSP